MNETIKMTTESTGFGAVTYYTSGNVTVAVQRRDLLDYYGNPIYFIAPQGYSELPYIKGFRRNRARHHYSTQSYNIDETMNFFFERVEGTQLYVNSAAHVEYI